MLVDGTVGRAQGDEQRLRFRRLELEGKEQLTPPLEIEVAHDVAAEQFAYAAHDRTAGRQRIEQGARVHVLRVTPDAGRGIVPVFEPAIVLRNGDALIGVGDRLPGRRGNWWRRLRRRERGGGYDGAAR